MVPYKLGLDSVFHNCAAVVLSVSCGVLYYLDEDVCISRQLCYSFIPRVMAFVLTSSKFRVGLVPTLGSNHMISFIIGPGHFDFFKCLVRNLDSVAERKEKQRKEGTENRTAPVRRRTDLDRVFVWCQSARMGKRAWCLPACCIYLWFGVPLLCLA